MRLDQIPGLEPMILTISPGCTQYQTFSFLEGPEENGGATAVKDENEAPPENAAPVATEKPSEPTKHEPER